jgi:hypothetical protein
MTTHEDKQVKKMTIENREEIEMKDKTRQHDQRNDRYIYMTWLEHTKERKEEEYTN